MPGTRGRLAREDVLGEVSARRPSRALLARVSFKMSFNGLVQDATGGHQSHRHVEKALLSGTVGHELERRAARSTSSSSSSNLPSDQTRTGAAHGPALPLDSHTELYAAGVTATPAPGALG